MTKDVRMGGVDIREGKVSKGEKISRCQGK